MNKKQSKYKIQQVNKNILNLMSIICIVFFTLSCKNRKCPKIDLKEIGYDTSFYNIPQNIVMFSDTLEVSRISSEFIQENKRIETFMSSGKCDNGYYYTLQLDSTDLYVNMYFVAEDTGYMYGASSYYFEYFDIKIKNIHDIDTIINCISSSPYPEIHLYQGKIISLQ